MFKFLIGVLAGILVSLLIASALRSFLISKDRFSGQALKNPALNLYDDVLVDKDRVFALSTQLDKQAIMQSHIVYAFDRTSLREVWNCATDGGTKHLQISQGRLFLLGQTINVFDANTGKQLLTFEIPDVPVQSLVASGDWIYYQTVSGVFAINLVDRKIVWQIAVPGNIRNVPIRSCKEDVIFLSGDNIIYFVDKQTGATKAKILLPEV